MMKEKKTVLALGFFDGLHLGHAALLHRAKEVSQTLGAEAAVLTFDVHPDLFVRGEAVRLVCSAHDRAYILRRFFGIDRVRYVHFNAETMRTDWRVFLEQLVGVYHGTAHFVVGYDFRFGYGGCGTAELLREWCASRGLGCDVIPAVTLDGGVVSSTRIRALLAEGDIAAANRLLGHPYLLTDTVRTGFRLGRTMDYPTVNMRFEDGVLTPRFGAYASRVLLPEDGEVKLDAVTNVGVRPTFDESGARVTVETHIFDFDAEIYGKRLCVEFCAFLRPERPFASPEALSAQIREDAVRAREFLRKEKSGGH